MIALRCLESRRRTLVSDCGPLLVFVVALVATLAQAVPLPEIDRLADAPVPAAVAANAGRGRDAGASVHSRLGVPTFVWGHRGSAADRAQTAQVPRSATPEAAARAYLRALADLYAMPPAQADAAALHSIQHLPNGGALVKFRNRIDDVEVFREEAAVLIGAGRELEAVGGFVSGGSARGAFRGSNANAAAAVAAALGDWNIGAARRARLVPAGEQDEYRHFDLPPTSGADAAAEPTLAAPLRVKPVLFRLPDALRSAWYVEVQMNDPATRDVDGYAYVIDDEDGSVLFRHNLSADAAFTYRVFAEASGSNLPLPGGAIGRNGFPHPTGVPDGYQAPSASSNLVTLQNTPFSRNDPWLPAGATVTTGNNVDAFADRSGPDGFNGSDQRPTTTSAGVFDYAHNPALTPGASSNQINASIVNLFYLNNWLHDWFYDSGFDEAAGNAQTDNFGRGGIGNDSIIAEGQDFAGLNNANMLTPADGSRPRMRMYVFNAKRPATTALVSPATSYPSVGASFGPQTFNVTGPVVLGNPETGCSPMANLAGAIAVVSGSSCAFQTRVANAEAAGASGVIVIDTDNALPGFMSSPIGGGTPVSIPATIVSSNNGSALKTLLLSQTVTATIAGAFLPDRDGTLDNMIVAHEWGHYLTNRLVTNAVGLGSNQAGSMGEGWGDFIGLLTFVKQSDAALPNNTNFDGTYSGGSYVLAGPASPASQGAYFGVRRYPNSRDMAKNPLTFKHVANGVALPVSPAPAFGADGSNNAEVHNSGEVWSAMLWECYSNLLQDTLGGSPRLTFAQAQDRMKRYLVMGLKLTPTSPTFIEARDALLAAIVSQDSQDHAKCLQGFTKRGLGIGAVAPDRYSTTHAGAVENFTLGGALAVTAIALSDAAGACDVDGTLDNGESGTLSITVQNIGIAALSATTGTVGTSNPHVLLLSGGALVFPPMQPGQSVTLTIPVQVANAATAETAQFNISVDDPSLSIPRPVTATRIARLNSDVIPNQSASDDVEAPGTTWTTGTTFSGALPGVLWQRVAISDTDHRWRGPDLDGAMLTWLQSPPLNVAPTGSFTFSFRHRHSFEYDLSTLVNYDGGQIQISTNGGGSWTSVGALATPGYNGTLTTGFSNPMTGSAYVKRNAAWPSLETVTVDLGTAYAGQTVLIRFAIGTDSGGVAEGWDIDDVAFTNLTNLPFPQRGANNGSCLTVMGGDQQWALFNTAFPNVLSAQLRTTGGAPLAGVAVTFSTPGSGASASFGGAPVVITDALGIANSPVVTANGTAGAFVATATAGTKNAVFRLSNAAATPTLDIDGDGHYDVLTDGVLLIRYLQGLTGNALTAGALGFTPQRNAAQIKQYLDAIRPLLDIDNDGQVDLATDGALMLRYLAGFRGSALIGNATSAAAKRLDAGALADWLDTLRP